MTLSRTQADKVAVWFLGTLERKYEMPLAIVAQATREYDFGWLYSWTRRRREVHLGAPSGELKLFGNGPFVVAKESGEITKLGTRLNIDQMVEHLRREGEWPKPYRCVECPPEIGVDIVD